MQEVEAENQTLQRNLEELKISSKRLEQLEQEVRRRKPKKLINHPWKITNLKKMSRVCFFSGLERVPHQMADGFRWFMDLNSQTYFLSLDSTRQNEVTHTGPKSKSWGIINSRA